MKMMLNYMKNYAIFVAQIKTMDINWIASFCDIFPSKSIQLNERNSIGQK